MDLEVIMAAEGGRRGDCGGWCDSCLPSQTPQQLEQAVNARWARAADQEPIHRRTNPRAGDQSHPKKPAAENELAARFIGGALPPERLDSSKGQVSGPIPWTGMLDRKATGGQTRHEVKRVAKAQILWIHRFPGGAAQIVVAEKVVVNGMVQMGEAHRFA